MWKDLKMKGKHQKILRWIRGFFCFVYGLSWLIAALFLLAGVVMPFSPAVKNDFCGVWINFTLQDPEPSFRIGETIYQTTLTRTTGWLLIEDGPLLLAYLNLLLILSIVSVGLYVLKKTIRIVERVQQGRVFLVENMLDLRRISIILLLFFPFQIALRISAGWFTLGQLVGGPLADTGLIGASLDFDLDTLAFPLFLWVLAEVFRAGIELKKDQELTI